MTIAQRVRRAFGHRPWTVDVVSGVVLMAYGLFILHDPCSIVDRTAFDFLDAFNVMILAGIISAIGCVQLVSALINVLLLRWISALLACGFWSGLAIGVHGKDPHASTIVLMLGAALSNALILLRLY